jgi:hypothetical protein
MLLVLAIPLDPERILAERFKFTSGEIAQVRQSQPVVKVQADRQSQELALVGAIRLPGKKERLSDWVRNIEVFRRAAELGEAHVVPMPPNAAAFADVPLDEADRQALLDRTIRYVTQGGDLPLLGRASTLTALAPDLVAYFSHYPAAPLTGAESIFYWSSTPVGSATVIGVHHLVVYRAGPGEVWIADRLVYASRYFDAGALVIGLYDAPDGAGFYAVAGSRVKSSQLQGKAAAVLRKQIERSAADSVRMYLEWMRDSLAQPGNDERVGENPADEHH